MVKYVKYSTVGTLWFRWYLTTCVVSLTLFIVHYINTRKIHHTHPAQWVTLHNIQAYIFFREMWFIDCSYLMTVYTSYCLKWAHYYHFASTLERCIIPQSSSMSSQAQKSFCSSIEWILHAPGPCFAIGSSLPSYSGLHFQYRGYQLPEIQWCCSCQRFSLRWDLDTN